MLRKKALARDLHTFVRTTYTAQQTFFPDENTGAFWDDIFAADEAIFPMERWRIQKVVELVNPEQSILNLGVGSGKLEQALVERYPNHELDYLGTDIAKATIAKLKQQFSQLQFRVGGLTAISPKEHQFNQVLLLEVLEHIKPSQTFAVLKHIYQLLSPKGRFFVSVPVNEGLELMLPKNPNSHMRLYSEELLRFELESVGFSVEQVFRTAAFNDWFWFKHAVNSVMKLRQPNNLLFVCTK